MFSIAISPISCGCIGAIERPKSLLNFIVCFSVILFLVLIPTITMWVLYGIQAKEVRDFNSNTKEAVCNVTFCAVQVTLCYRDLSMSEVRSSGMSCVYTQGFYRCTYYCYDIYINLTMISEPFYAINETWGGIYPEACPNKTQVGCYYNTLDQSLSYLDIPKRGNTNYEIAAIALIALLAIVVLAIVILSIDRRSTQTEPQHSQHSQHNEI